MIIFIVILIILYFAFKHMEEKNKKNNKKSQSQNLKKRINRCIDKINDDIDTNRTKDSRISKKEINHKSKEIIKDKNKTKTKSELNRKYDSREIKDCDSLIYFDSVYDNISTRNIYDEIDYISKNKKNNLKKSKDTQSIDDIDFKKGVIIKEILDKPVSYRRR